METFKTKFEQTITHIEAVRKNVLARIGSGSLAGSDYEDALLTIDLMTQDCLAALNVVERT